LSIRLRRDKEDFVIRRLAIAMTLAVLTFLSLEAHAQQAFYSVTPCRAVDTRNPVYGGIVYASTQRNFTIKGVCGVPPAAKSVTLTLTVVGPTVDGFVTLWTNGGTYPLVSNINFLAGPPSFSLANAAVIGLAVTTPDLATAYGSSTGGGTLHLILDVTGYFK
jgi:hypothetical protein